MRFSGITVTDELINHEIKWIDSNERLEECCVKWEEAQLLALDTEFVRTTTYYPIAGLLQINDGSCTILIDPLEIDDWYPLVELFESESLTIAMHACSEDLEVLQMEIGSVPKCILDTQIATAFLGGAASLGYANLVQRELNVEIPKSETRSDWLQRPLSKPQVQYAALDVEYLYVLAKKLENDLVHVDRLDWVKEEGRRLYQNFKRLQDVNHSFKRVKSAWKLSRRKLAVLVALCRWRENYAQQHDIPRNRVIKEKALFELALNCPKHISKLRTIEGISERVIRSQGATIIRLVAEQLNLDEADLPAALEAPLTKADQEPYKLLKSRIHALADALNIAPELLFKKKEIEALYRMKMNDEWPAINDFFVGWRANVVADEVKEALNTI